jgi:hypothetical protein
MTNPGDEWDNMLDNLGLGDTHPPEAPPEPPPESAEAPRGRRRRSSEDAPKRRRRAPKSETTEGEPMPVDEFAGGIISELDAPSDEGAEPSTEGDEGEPRKRRRRRSRRKKGTAEGALVDAEAGVAEGMEDDGEPVDVSPIENYASLNIPSWQELIDGLYKP